MRKPQVAQGVALGYGRAKVTADSLVGHWRKMGHPEEAIRLEVATRGRNDPPKDYTEEDKYDRVEIIITAEPVFRKRTLKNLSGDDLLVEAEEVKHS